jgi:hypothetical protein
MKRFSKHNESWVQTHIFYAAAIIAAVLALAACEEDPVLSGETAITAFSIGNQTGAIDGTNITVTLPYGAGTGVTYTVSAGATVQPKTLENSAGVSVYTVTAENGATQDYTVTVTRLGRAGNTLSAFSIGGQMGTITGKNITVELPFGITETTVTYTHSEGATVRLTSAENSAGVSVYTVTSESGVDKVYTVTVRRQGQGGIGLSLDDGGDILTGTIPVLSKTGTTKTATLEAALEYTNCQWYVDTLLKGEGQSFTLNAAAYPVGKHYLSVEAWRNGRLYSKELTFTVNND